MLCPAHHRLSLRQQLGLPVFLGLLESLGLLLAFLRLGLLLQLQLFGFLLQALLFELLRGSERAPFRLLFLLFGSLGLGFDLPNLQAANHICG